MENIETNNKNYTELLQNVRKAHRLIYSYQDCLMSIAKFIGVKLGFKKGDMIGYKPFCDRLHSKQTSNSNYRTFNLDNKTPFQVEGRWAWDFIDSYEIEYTFEKKNIGGKEYYLSIFQVTDNGYFLFKEKEGKSEKERRNVEKFEKVENSQSYLIVALYNEAVAKAEDAAKDIYFQIQEALYTAEEGKDMYQQLDEKGQESIYAQRFKIEDLIDKGTIEKEISNLQKKIKEWETTK